MTRDEFISSTADRIIELINSQVRSPRKEELAKIIGEQADAWKAAEQAMTFAALWEKTRIYVPTDDKLGKAIERAMDEPAMVELPPHRVDFFFEECKCWMAKHGFEYATVAYDVNQDTRDLLFYSVNRDVMLRVVVTGLEELQNSSPAAQSILARAKCLEALATITECERSQPEKTYQ